MDVVMEFLITGVFMAGGFLGILISICYLLRDKPKEGKYVRGQRVLYRPDPTVIHTILKPIKGPPNGTGSGYRMINGLNFKASDLISVEELEDLLDK